MTWALRRLVIAPALVLGTLLLLVTLPLWVIVTLALSPALPGRWRALRLLWVAMLYLVAESLLLLVMLGLWLASGFGWRLRSPYFAGIHYDLAQWVLVLFFREAKRVLALNIRTDGPAPDAHPDKPILVCCRHAGPGDSFTLMYALLHWYGREPRVVLKDTLAWDPEIDVLAYRLERILGKSAAERTANEQLQELTTDQLAAERERLADALKTDELLDAFAQRHLESAHKSAVKREQDVLGRIGLLNDRLDQTPWYKRKEFKSYLELREEATKQLAAAEIERRVAELDHLENIKATKEWLKKFGELAEEYLEVSRLHGDRLQLDQHVQHRIEKLELPATRLEAKHAVEPPKAVVRELDLNGPDLSDGPDLGM